MDKKGIVSLFGAVVVLLGLFTPVLTVPEFGDINYLFCVKGYSALLIVFVVLSVIFAHNNRYRAMAYSGSASFVVVAFTYYDIHKRLSGLNADAAQTYHLSWGWAVLAAGIGTIMASAAFKKNAPMSGSRAVSEM